MKKWIYEVFYRFPFVPIAWIFGSPHEIPEYRKLFKSGRIPPGRAIDLGCGEGSNAVYLAKIGFDTTGVDFSPTAIKRARANANKAGLEVRFFEDDLTNLQQVNSKFDLLVDFGALNDLNQTDRDAYMQNIIPLTRPGSHYILMCFANSLPPDEIERRFTQLFSIEMLNERTESITYRSLVLYLMTRN
jgi:cyclopropane fatty-acyl-phospholipid synthase-like methyltransferase